MKVLILGAGVIGVTTAYFLQQRGYEVTVIDRADSCARACSYANGGQLSYNHAEPWASMGAVKKAMKWIGRDDAPLLFRVQPDRYMWKWVMQFLSNCTPGKVHRNTETLLRLGLYSREVTHQIQEALQLEFHYQRTGKYFIFERDEDYQATLYQLDYQQQLGGHYQRLTPEECLEHEPAFAHVAPRIIGGIYDPDDETGDMYDFTVEMERYLREQGVQFMYGCTVERILTASNRVIAVQTSQGEMQADSYVMALGCHSPLYLRPLGMDIPIYPMKGYSISVPIEDENKAPSNSVTHGSQKVVYSRLGNVLRVAGTAEFAGYDDSITPGRIAMLKRGVEDIFPGCGDVGQAGEWACLRPQTPDGPPVLGSSHYRNLFLNIGHGTLGWTQAAGSARIVADVMTGETPQISLAGLTQSRYN